MARIKGTPTQLNYATLDIGDVATLTSTTAPGSYNELAQQANELTQRFNIQNSSRPLPGGISIETSDETSTRNISFTLEMVQIQDAVTGELREVPVNNLASVMDDDELWVTPTTGFFAGVTYIEAALYKIHKYVEVISGYIIEGGAYRSLLGTVTSNPERGLFTGTAALGIFSGKDTQGNSTVRMQNWARVIDDQDGGL